MKKRKITALLMSVILMLTYSAVFAPSATASTASIATYDSVTGEAKADFSPEETVLIAGPGFPATTNIDVKVTRPDGTMVTGDGTYTPGYDTVTTDSSGNLSYNYILDGIEGLYAVDAVESATGTVLATTTFTDSKFYLRGLDKVDNKWTGGNLNGWNELDWVPYRLKIAVVSRDLDPGTGVFAKTFAIQHDNQWTGSGGPDPGVDETNDFYIGNEAGSPIGGATWVLDPSTPSYVSEPNTTVIQYEGTFTATIAGTYYLYWKAHIALGASGWSGSSLHAHTTASGSQDVPIKVPGAAPTPDTQAPTGTVTINSGATYTNSTSATLTLSATDNVGVTEMMVSNDPAFTGAVWEPYATTKAWTLTSGADGTRTVYAKFRDAALNESTVASDSIILDTALPGAEPVITNVYHSPAPPLVGQTVDVYADVTDDYAVDVVYLYYIPGSIPQVGPITMVNIGGNTYWAQIPGYDVIEPQVEYHIEAFDGAGNGSSSGYNTIIPLTVPVITNISPTSGPVGTSVTITGTDFGATQGTSTVTFNGVTATIISWSDTSIVAIVPAGATDGPVVVTTSAGSSSGVFFDVTAPAPSITSLAPTSGPVGTSVTITGTDFGATQGTSTVTFNGVVASISSWSDTSIVAIVPAGATDGNVVVTTSAGSSNGVFFDVTVVVAPSTPTWGAVTPGENLNNLSWNANSEPDIAYYEVYRHNKEGWGRTEERDPGIIYDSPWYTGTNSGYSGGATRYIANPGSDVIFTFTGTGVTWIAAKANNRGMARVYIDGSSTPDATVDLYASNGGTQQSVYTKSGLAYGPHTIKVEVAGLKNNLSSGYTVDVDAMDVNTGSGTVRYEEYDFAFDWNGEWRDYFDPVYSGGSTKYIDLAGATATYTFEGSGIRWIAAKTTNRGKAEVRIDGVLDATVDLYASTGAGQQIVYQKTGLTIDPVGHTITHTVEIKATGTKNASSSGVVVELDAFEVYIPGDATLPTEPSVGELPITTVTSPALIDGSPTLYNGITYRYWLKAVNTSSLKSGFSASLDGTPALKILTRYEQTATQFTWSGTWYNYSSPDYSGGSTKYTNVAGAYAIFTFSGYEVRYIASKVPNRGVARIEIDDGSGTFVPITDGDYDTDGNGTLDGIKLYDVVVGTGKLTVYKKSWATKTTRRIKVISTGIQPTGSTNKYIDVDAMDVQQTQ